MEFQRDPDPRLDQFGVDRLWDGQHDLERAYYEQSAAALRAGNQDQFLALTMDFESLMLRYN